MHGNWHIGGKDLTQAFVVTELVDHLAGNNGDGYGRLVDTLCLARSRRHSGAATRLEQGNHILEADGILYRRIIRIDAQQCSCILL